MVNPSGYTALDLIGFTDRGAYDPSAYYVKNDLVHDANDSIWRVLIDDTHGVTPVEGLNYTIFMRNQQDAAKQIIAPVETNPATGSHAAGTQLIFNDVLHDVTTAISATDALVVYPDTGYNIKPAPLVTSQIQALANEKADKADENLFFNNGSGYGCTAMTGNFCIIRESEITVNHVVTDIVFSKPSAITSDVTWTTANGSLTLNGTCGDGTCKVSSVTLSKAGNI